MLWAWDAALGLVLGSSVASVASSRYGHHPDGDAPLWAPGGLDLLDLAHQSMAARGPLLSAALVVVVAARLAGLLPSAAVFAELLFTTRARRAPPWREAVSHGILALPASFTLEIFTLAAQASVVMLGVVAVAAASASATATFGDRGGDIVLASVGLASLAAATVVGAIGDLARAAVVRWDARALVAGKRGLESFAARPAALTWSFAWRALSSWVPVAIGAWLAGRIGGRGGASLLVLGAFHQGVVLVRAAVRASWMARALRAV